MRASFSSSRATAPTCEHCGGELATRKEQREGFCSHYKCRGPAVKRLAEKARQKQAERRQVHDKFADEVRAVLSAELGPEWTGVDNPVLVVVPSLQRELVDQSESRVSQFRDHLKATMQAAQQEIAQPASHEALETMHADTDPPAPLPIINACTTCRGECCTQGGEHAFLKRDFLAWRLLKESDTTPDQMIAQYLSLLPEQAYEDSCVYHGAEGCVLPRRIRSRTCNTFVCTGISHVQEHWRQQPRMASVAASVDGGNCHRVGLMAADATRVERQLNVPLGNQGMDTADSA